MKPILFFPSKVWTFGVFSSSLLSALVFGIFQFSLGVFFFRLTMQIFIGYTIGLLLYFPWVWISHYLIKNIKNYFRKKTSLCFLAIIFSALIFVSVSIFTKGFWETFGLFDPFSFGLMLIAGIWLYAFEFEIPDGREDVLDDIYPSL